MRAMVAALTLTQRLPEKEENKWVQEYNAWNGTEIHIIAHLSDLQQLQTVITNKHICLIMSVMIPLCFSILIEVEVQCCLTRSATHEMTPGFKERWSSTISSNEDVLFYWWMLSTEEEKTLLGMLINLWITIYRFSFAKSWLEMFKRETKKGTQNLALDGRQTQWHQLKKGSLGPQLIS